MAFRETAHAKINLSLTVLGKRPDGYHDIESLVTFASVGDGVTLTPADDCQVETSGPFAAEITGENLLAKALRLMRKTDATLKLGSVHLEKNLPVAAGIGGGSADAAALLRAVRRANPDQERTFDWEQVAAALGADVPVCLAGRTAFISGIGHEVRLAGEIAGLAAAGAVLVNPRQPLSTADVYRALAAGPAAESGMRPATSIGDLAGLLGYMRDRGNDLERPAIGLLPAIGEVKAALVAQPGCLVSAMSGSGPTCFGIFASAEAAIHAAAVLQRAHAHWWVASTCLGDATKEG